jgi:hypothetical protein
MSLRRSEEKRILLTQQTPMLYGWFNTKPFLHLQTAWEEPDGEEA